MTTYFGYQIEPIPDETFAGLVITAGILAGYTTYSQAYRGILGEWTTSPASLLPRDLVKLIPFLPAKYQENPNCLCDEHTALPYFKNFVDSEILSRVQDSMLNGTSLNIHNAIGLTNARIQESRFLKYCEVCAQEQVVEYGRSTWLRTHQLPGVFVCHKHGVQLIDSPIPTVHYGSNLAEIQLPHMVCTTRAYDRSTWEDGQSWDHSFPQRLIAQISHQILVGSLAFPNRIPKSLIYKDAYLAAAPKGPKKVDWDLVENLLRNKYGDLVPRQLGINFNCRQATHWVCQMSHKNRMAQHPLFHILILGAMFESLEQLNSKIQEPQVIPTKYQARHLANRDELMQIISEFPNANRPEVRRKLGIRKYRSILAYDRVWAESVLPSRNYHRKKRAPTNKKMSNRSEIDWIALDEKFSKELKTIDPRSILRSHKGEYFSNNAELARITDQSYTTIRKLVTLPKSKAILDTAIESLSSDTLRSRHL